MPPIWVKPGQASALPIITSAAIQLTTELGIEHIVTGIQHQVAGWARVIAVDNGENRREHSERVGTVVRVAVGIEKKKEKIF